MSKSVNFIILIALASPLLSACAAQTATTPAPLPTQGGNPYAPQPLDETMVRADAEIVSSEVLEAKSLPPQISLLLSFRLATPCHQLRVRINPPDSQNLINVEIYGVVTKDMPCSMMAILTPLETTVNLGVYPLGYYTVWVNGQQVGEFNSR
jgi:hypothetical protein